MAHPPGAHGDPLENHPRYEKVWVFYTDIHDPDTPSTQTIQVKDINRGSYGFVVLALDKANQNEQVAIKFIKRGNLVCTQHSNSTPTACMSH